jgi:hypothetical protein
MGGKVGGGFFRIVAPGQRKGGNQNTLGSCIYTAASGFFRADEARKIPVRGGISGKEKRTGWNRMADRDDNDHQDGMGFDE